MIDNQQSVSIINAFIYIIADFYRRRKLEYLEKTIDLLQVTYTLVTLSCIMYTSPQKSNNFIDDGNRLLVNS
jgi:hypothetical protein